MTFEQGSCLGDGQTEAEGVSSQVGRGDALLWRMPPISYLTCSNRLEHDDLIFDAFRLSQ